MTTAVKICGCVNRGDVALALAWEAHFVGFIFAPSPREANLRDVAPIALDLPTGVSPVAVFVNPSHDDVARVLFMIPNALIQLSGDESPEFVHSLDAPVIKAIHVPAEGMATAEIRERCNRFASARILFDTKRSSLMGGTGETFAWDCVAPIASEREVFVAGGLRPENVSTCIERVRPFGVDVRSGVESDGRKDPVMLRAFVEAVRRADAT